MLTMIAKRLLFLAAAPARAEGFSGAGSTFAHPLLARWGQVHATLQGEGGAYVAAESNLDYEPVGSTAGVMRVLQGAVDFGATDVPLPLDEVAKHNLAQFPFVTGGVAVVVDVQGVATNALRLSGPVLADIYLGKVARWSDPAIRELNPGIGLPDAAIAPLRRRDGSGTTYHFTAYFAAASPEWRSRVGVDTPPSWPVGAGAKGNQELALRPAGPSPASPAACSGLTNGVAARRGTDKSARMDDKGASGTISTKARDHLSTKAIGMVG